MNDIDEFLEHTLDADPKPRTQTRRSGVAATVRAWVKFRRRG